jgi:hypothetical protein
MINLHIKYIIRQRIKIIIEGFMDEISCMIYKLRISYQNVVCVLYTTYKNFRIHDKIRNEIVTGTR